MIFHLGYIDPGTGSIVIQALVGGFLGAAYVGRKFISQAGAAIKSAFSTRQNSNEDDSNIEVRD